METIYYYVLLKDGTAYGWLATDTPVNDSRYTQVANREAYERLGGNPNYVQYSSLKPEINESVKVLKAQVEALSQYNDFLESCIVELAQLTLGGEV